MSKSKLAPLALLAAVLGGCAVQTTPTDEKLGKIDTIVVLYAENRSFDHLWGTFPGANGLANATPAQWTQRDHDGSVLPEIVIFARDGKPDPKYPKLANKPFRIDQPPINGRLDEVLISPIHAYYHNIQQINDGRNDRFVAMSDKGGWVMGNFDGSSMKTWQWAKDYTLADNFFMGAFGGSYLNHQYLICACAPYFPNPPESMRTVLNPDGTLKLKPGSPSASVGAVQTVVNALGGQVTPDGYTVNTSQPPYQPSGIPPAAGGNPALADPNYNGPSRALLGVPVPPQTATTIGDTMSAKGVTWAWYAGGYRQALADGMQPPDKPREVIYNSKPPSPNFQPHHQPFNYYARFAPGTKERELHLKDGTDFTADIEAGKLPQVSFYKPQGRLNEHPSYTDVLSGDAHIAELLDRLRKSPQWKSMLVIVTYDENGGFWDHVSPPTGYGSGDRWGPGNRVAALVVSPFAKQGYIDKTQYDTTSILKLITRRYGLEPLPGVRRNVGDFSAALQ